MRATLEMTGGYMRTAVISTAYEAAAQGARIHRRHILAGARSPRRSVIF